MTAIFCAIPCPFAAAVSPEREAALLASVPTGLLINGEWRDASDGGTFDVHDPATGEVLATLASATSEDAVAAWTRPMRRRRPGRGPHPGCGPRSCAGPLTWSPNGPRTSPC